MAKVESLLARLRGEEPPPEETPAAAAPPAIAEDQLAPLRSKIEELEGKLAALQAPPAPISAEEPPPVEETPPPEPPPVPPAPPTELVLFLNTKVELLERKLELAQQEALRANLVLREREEAQRKAQREVEELFHSMREQQRAVAFDRQLREQYALAQHRIEDLGARLAMAELRMLPAQEALAALEKENGVEELKALLHSRIEKAVGARQSSTRDPSAPASPSALPAEGALPSIPSLAPAAPAAAAEAGTPLVPPPQALAAGSPPEFAAVLGKVSDLERRLEESERARVAETQKRLSWETGVLEALKQSAGRWFRAGGPELLVESALETLVESLQKRDALSADMTKTLEALRAEPPGSPAAAAMRDRLAELRRAIESAQLEIDKRMAVVNAWVESRQGGK